MFRSLLRTDLIAPLRCSRTFASTSSRLQEVKVPIALIAELRKHNPVSLSKARQALSASGNSVDAALEWLQKDLASSGMAKAAKLSSKSAKEGLIGVSLMGTRASMVDLRCETDFVARADVFRDLVNGVAHTAAFLDANTAQHSSDLIAAFPNEELLQAPRIPTNESIAEKAQSNSASTIQEAITAAVTQTGENIQLHRAVNFTTSLSTSNDSSAPLLLPGVYVHGAVPGGSGNEGTVGGLVIISVASNDGSKQSISQRLGQDTSIASELQKLSRALARQIVGFPTKAISRAANESGEEGAEFLLEQPFMMYQGESRTVAEVLKSWGKEHGVEVEVKAMQRWSVGEDA